MKHVKILGVPFKLRGPIIDIGKKLSFRAVDRHQKVVYLRDYVGPKIISFFPNIQTRVCTTQTLKIAKLAQKYPQILFISISADSVEKINKWCLAKGIENVIILSDEFHDFAIKTNLGIVRMKRLARGLIITNEKNEIIDMSIAYNLTKEPNYQIVEQNFAKENYLN